MPLHGLHSDEQRVRDLLVGVFTGGQLRHPPFAGGQHAGGVGAGRGTTAGDAQFDPGSLREVDRAQGVGQRHDIITGLCCDTSTRRCPQTMKLRNACAS